MAILLYPRVLLKSGERLQQILMVKTAYMPTVMNHGHPQYTYRLKGGITADRQGMLIIENEGILDLLK